MKEQSPGDPALEGREESRARRDPTYFEPEDVVTCPILKSILFCQFIVLLSFWIFSPLLLVFMIFACWKLEATGECSTRNGGL